MPVSSGSFDEVVAAALSLLKPRRVLDIGCGAGKYGYMARAAAPDATVEGVEIEPSYVERFNLNELYSPLHLMSATDIPGTMIDEFFDVAIIGDCIEHLPKSEGMDLLNFLTYRAAYTILVLPETSIQNTVDNIRSEAHVAVWSERDFGWHDNWAFAQVWQMQLYFLRGYSDAAVSLQDLVSALHARQFTVHYDTVSAPLNLVHTNLTKTFPGDTPGTSVYWRRQ